MSTDAAQQPLPKDGLQSGRNKEWFRAHVDQTRDRARRIIGVERSKNQVARERRLNGNLRRLQITRFSNHDAIRILPQEVAQNSSKGQADAFIHRHLHDSLQIVLNGLLGSDQLRINRVDLAQTGVKRRRLSGPRRPCGDKNSVRTLDHFQQEIVDVIRHSQRFEIQIDDAAIEHAEHQAFAKLRRQS